MKRNIEIVGHGGAGDFFPSNSLPSIRKAIELKVERIEIDLLISSDEDLVLVHDDHLEDDAGAKQPVRNLTTDQVRRRVDQLLTLSKFFEMTGPSMPVLLDFKRPGYEQAVVDELHRHAPRDVWISTTYASSIVRLHRLFPEATLGLSSGHIASGFAHSPLAPLLAPIVRVLMPVPLLIAAKVCGARMIMVNHRACSAWLVGVAQAGGLGVAVWTVNKPSDIRRAAAMGVDAIISNRPDLVREIVDI